MAAGEAAGDGRLPCHNWCIASAQALRMTGVLALPLHNFAGGFCNTCGSTLAAQSLYVGCTETARLF
jgi:hypothetical protein